MRRRLDLASALVHEPRVLFLDEPTTGLDPVSRKAIWEEVEALNREGTTVFLTTQYLEEADQLADRVGIIARAGSSPRTRPTALKAEVGKPRLEIVLADGDAEQAKTAQRRVRRPAAARRTGKLMIEVDGAPRAIAPVVRALDEAGILVESLDLVEPTLDDVFVDKTGQHLEGAETEASAADARARQAALGVSTLRPTSRRRRARPALGPPDLPPPAADGADHHHPDAAARRADAAAPAARVDLPGFPPVDSFFDFMLAGAMIQSALLAGNSGGHRDRDRHRDGLHRPPARGADPALRDRPRPAGRNGGARRVHAVWFLAVGLIFGATIEEGVPGALLMIVLVTLAAVAFGTLGAAIALRTGSASVVQGLFPLVFVILFLSSAFFPADLLLEPAQTIAEYQPAQLHRRRRPRPGDLVAHLERVLRRRSGRSP